MRVIVLMSTFNGEKYIDAQIRSILDQLPSDGLLMVRDDGSHDGTVARIRAFNDARIQLLLGENIGFAHSFLTLLSLAPSDTDMVMFSDQDDVWLDGKIQRAWEHLQPLAHRPALYCSAQMLANEALVILHPTPPWPRPPSFSNALAENIVTGCTAALNRPAIQLMQGAGVPRGVQFHDWWLYLVISAFGIVVFDDQPTVLYRQHGKNHIGHGAGWWGRQMQMVKFLLKHDWVGILLGQVAALKYHYGKKLGDTECALLIRFFDTDGDDLRIRWSLIFSLLRLRQRRHHEVFFRLLATLHRLRLWLLADRLKVSR